MKRYYKNDFRKIGRVSRVASYAEAIGKKEKVNMGLLLCTAYLHNIGTGELRSPSGSDQDLKARSIDIASEILEKLGAKEQIKDEVCRQIEIFGTDDAGSCPECLVLSDAVQLVSLEEQRKKQNADDQFCGQLESKLLTTGGRLTAQELFT